MDLEKESLIKRNCLRSNELLRGAMARVGEGHAHSDELEVKLGVHQGSVLSPLLFAKLADVMIIENAKDVIN